MPTFIPPTTSYAYPTGNRLLDRLSIPRGICVYSTDGGLTWQQNEVPWQGDLGSMNPLTSQLNGRVDGIDYFQGGRIYTITAAQATTLTNAGYGAYITD